MTISAISIYSPGVSQLVRDELKLLLGALSPNAAEDELNRVLPYKGFSKFRSTRLSRLRLPAEAGGLGGTLEDLFHVIVSLAAEDSNLAHALRLHFDTTEWLRLVPKTPFTRLQAERAAQGAIFGGASTELGTAKPGEIATVLRKSADGFTVSGRKYYATGTAFSDFARINLKDEDGGDVMIVIPVGREGVTVEDDWNGMGQRMTASGSLVLDNVAVKADEVTERGFESLVGRHCSAVRQLHLVATAAGVVRNIFNDARNYVLKKGRPAKHSGAESARDDVFIQQVIGELASSAQACEALVYQSARELDRAFTAILKGSDDAETLVLQAALSTAQTQLVVSQLSLKAGERIYEAGGASATSRALNLDRHWRNLRTIFSHNPLAHKARVLGDFYLNGTETHLKEGRVF